MKEIYYTAVRIAVGVITNIKIGDEMNRIFKLNNDFGVMVIMIESISHSEFGKLMAEIYNIIGECSEETGATLDDIYSRINGVSWELIEMAIQELIDNEEIYESDNGGYKYA